MGKNNEKVMAAGKKILESAGFADKTGFFTENARNIYEAAAREHFFIDRSLCENDYSLKQIIPYVIIMNNNNFLLFKRLEKQNEKRLHGMFSIGAGGHINEAEKYEGKDIITAGMYRELNEEVSLNFSGDPVFRGIVNNISNGVGKAHLGFVFIMETDDMFFRINEPEKMTGGWASPGELEACGSGLERWSRIILKDKNFRKKYIK